MTISVLASEGDERPRPNCATLYVVRPRHVTKSSLNSGLRDLCLISRSFKFQFIRGSLCLTVCIEERLTLVNLLVALKNRSLTPAPTLKLNSCFS